MGIITIKEAIEKSLEHLNQEAYYPLMNFAKTHLMLDIEKSMRDDLVWLATRFIDINEEFHLETKIFSTLNNTIAYIKKSLETARPKIAKTFFNFVNDNYARFVINNYLAETNHKTSFVDAMTDFAKKGIVEKIFDKLKKERIILTQGDTLELKAALESLVNQIEDNTLTYNNLTRLKAVMMPLSAKVKDIILDKIMQRKSFNKDLIVYFDESSILDLVEDFQSKISSYGIHLIKNAQAHQVYKYDGLIERVLPASIRGLYDVDKKIVEGIALNGDTSKIEDLFNYEVASAARYNRVYKVGHTGASNRSATTLANIAMYFASKHGLSHGRPHATWIMIYESCKGINTTELVDEKVTWTEFEFATPELKPKRFLGAVKFEVDDANSDDNNIAFKATEGFVVPRVHQDNYHKEGVESDIKHFLAIAKHFDKPLQAEIPKLDFNLPRDSKILSESRSFFQLTFDKLGLSHDPYQYKKSRLSQLDFVCNETDDKKKERLNKEKESLRFWHLFSEQFTTDASGVAPWLPSFKMRVKQLNAKQQPLVNKAVNSMLKLPNVTSFRESVTTLRENVTSLQENITPLRENVTPLQKSDGIHALTKPDPYPYAKFTVCNPIYYPTRKP